MLPEQVQREEPFDVSAESARGGGDDYKMASRSSASPLASSLCSVVCPLSSRSETLLRAVDATRRFGVGATCEVDERWSPASLAMAQLEESRAPPSTGLNARQARYPSPPPSPGRAALSAPSAMSGISLSALAASARPSRAFTASN